MWVRVATITPLRGLQTPSEAMLPPNHPLKQIKPEESAMQVPTRCATGATIITQVHANHARSVTVRAILKRIVR
jgi:hypothetical protein